MSDGQSRDLILYDGDCGLCQSSVQFLLLRDTRARFRFAPLQGRTAECLRKRAQIPSDLQSLVYVKNFGGPDESILVRSEATLTAVASLGFPWSLLSLLKIIPQGLRDRCYDGIASNRHAWFARPAACILARDGTSERFLD